MVTMANPTETLVTVSLHLSSHELTADELSQLISIPITVNRTCVPFGVNTNPTPKYKGAVRYKHTVEFLPDKSEEFDVGMGILAVLDAFEPSLSSTLTLIEDGTIMASVAVVIITGDRGSPAFEVPAPLVKRLARLNCSMHVHLH